MMLHAHVIAVRVHAQPSHGVAARDHARGAGRNSLCSPARVLHDPAVAHHLTVESVNESPAVHRPADPVHLDALPSDSSSARAWPVSSETFHAGGSDEYFSSAEHVAAGELTVLNEFLHGSWFHAQHSSRFVNRVRVPLLRQYPAAQCLGKLLNGL